MTVIEIGKAKSSIITRDSNRDRPDWKHLGDVQGLLIDEWTLHFKQANAPFIFGFKEGAIIEMNSALFAISPEALRFRARFLLRMANLVHPEGKEFWQRG